MGSKKYTDNIFYNMKLRDSLGILRAPEYIFSTTIHRFFDDVKHIVTSTLPNDDTVTIRDYIVKNIRIFPRLRKSLDIIDIVVILDTSDLTYTDTKVILEVMNLLADYFVYKNYITHYEKFTKVKLDNRSDNYTIIKV